MLSDFHILTVTYNDLNIDELGHFMVDHHNKDELNQKLNDLKVTFQFDEFIYLSTCNRVSYITINKKDWNQDNIKKFFLHINPKLEGEILENINKFVRVFKGRDAVNHIFEVASSIDSMVVGEREIFKQFREAYNYCNNIGLTGDHFRLMEKYVVNAAKSVYSHTKIGEKPLSVVSLAIQTLEKYHYSKDSRLLMIGAGETNKLVAKFLKKYNYSNVVVFNRNIDNASYIQELLEARAYHLRDLKSYTEGFDVIIICTGSTSAIIDDKLYKSLAKGDSNEKLIIDLSVPRNVEQVVIDLAGNHYVDIEQLRIIAEENLEYRKKEVVKGKIILKEKLIDFEKIFQQRQIEKAMKSVPFEIKEVKHKAIDQVFCKKLESVDDKSKALIIEMMDYMEKKMCQHSDESGETDSKVRDRVI